MKQAGPTSNLHASSPSGHEAAGEMSKIGKCSKASVLRLTELNSNTLHSHSLLGLLSCGRRGSVEVFRLELLHEHAVLP